MAISLNPRCPQKTRPRPSETSLFDASAAGRNASDDASAHRRRESPRAQPTHAEKNETSPSRRPVLGRACVTCQAIARKARSRHPRKQPSPVRCEISADDHEIACKAAKEFIERTTPKPLTPEQIKYIQSPQGKRDLERRLSAAGRVDVRRRHARVVDAGTQRRRWRCRHSRNARVER